MPKATPAQSDLSQTEIRKLILHYFYERNAHATSPMGKRGSAVKI
jgi:hypothetical protein